MCNLDWNPSSWTENKRRRHGVYVLCLYGLYFIVTDKHNRLMLPKVLRRSNSRSKENFNSKRLSKWGVSDWIEGVSNSWFSAVLTMLLTNVDQRSLQSTYMFDTTWVRLKYSVPYCYYWSSDCKLVLGSWYPFKWKSISYLFRSENFITLFTSAIPVTEFWKSWIQTLLR